MKVVLALLIFLIMLSVSEAQVFEYNNYCTGMTADTCKNVLKRSTCYPKEGVILFFKYEIKIDSITYYILSTDTIVTTSSNQERIIYYTEQRLINGEAACIIHDKKNRIVTLIIGDPLHKEIMHMNFYMHLLKY